MALYESTFIIRPDISGSDVKELMDRYGALIKEAGGKIHKSEYWGVRNLAYRINKNKKGHYAHLGLEASADAVKELERRMHLNDDVLRQLTVKCEAISEEPSPLMNSNDKDA